MAAITPRTPPLTASTLTTPPRTRDEKASRKPIVPNINAIIARTRPQNAPARKLATAQTIAMSEAMLNLAGVVSTSIRRAYVKRPRNLCATALKVSYGKRGSKLPRKHVRQLHLEPVEDDFEPAMEATNP